MMHNNVLLKQVSQMQLHLREDPSSSKLCFLTIYRMFGWHGFCLSI